jgi:hypothetical protein
MNALHASCGLSSRQFATASQPVARNALAGAGGLGAGVTSVGAGTGAGTVATGGGVGVAVTGGLPGVSVSHAASKAKAVTATQRSMMEKKCMEDGAVLCAAVYNSKS